MFEEEPNNNGDIKSTICPFPIPHRYKFSFSAVANWILMPDLLLATFFFCLRHTYGNISKTALDKVAREWQSSGKRRSGFVVRDCKHGRERREPGNIDAVLSLVSMVTHRTFLRIEFLLTSWTFCHSKLYKWDSCTAISPGTWTLDGCAMCSGGASPGQFSPEQLSSSWHLCAVLLWCRKKDIAAVIRKLKDSEKSFVTLWAPSCRQQINVWLSCPWPRCLQTANVFLLHWGRCCSAPLWQSFPSCVFETRQALVEP